MAATRPLTAVCAPAGYGKSTATIQWLEQRDDPYAWLSLGEVDNDPRWYMARLLAALQRAEPAGFELAGRALAAGASLEDSVIVYLVNELAERSGGSFAIVLDDYHLVEEGLCHKLTCRLLDTLPPGVGVVLTSRSTPPLGLGRRRAAGTVAELGPDELRLDRPETRRLLCESMQLDLDGEQLRLIEDRLGGWPAGVVLTGAALATHADRIGFLEALERSSEDLDVYLTEEVLEACSPELAEFLRRTSILDRLSGPLCEAVVGDARAAELLDLVRQMNLFVTPTEAHGTWLRYHQTFAAALSGQLERRTPQLVPELHRRAARWLESAGQCEEAIGHALRAGDGPHAAALLAEAWPELFADRRHATVRRILDRLPADRGDLGHLCDALDLLCMIYEGVDQRITAERGFDLAARAGEDPRVRLVVDGALISPFYGEVRRALEIAADAWERYAEQPELRSRLAPQIALLQWFAGNLEAVRDSLEPRLLLDQPTVGYVWTRAILALTAAEEGDAETAEALAREAWAEVVRVGGETATEFTAVPWILAEALRLRGALVEAREHMSRALTSEERRPGSVGHALALLYDARLALAEGDRARARRSARRARGIVERYPDLGVLPNRIAALEAALGGSADSIPRGSHPTPAELRVLAQLDSDLSLAEIAAVLYLSRDTVKSHSRRLYRRLGAGSRGEALLAARERGLLCP